MLKVVFFGYFLTKGSNFAKSTILIGYIFGTILIQASAGIVKFSLDRFAGQKTFLESNETRQRYASLPPKTDRKKNSSWMHFRWSVSIRLCFTIYVPKCMSVSMSVVSLCRRMCSVLKYIGPSFHYWDGSCAYLPRYLCRMVHALIYLPWYLWNHLSNDRYVGLSTYLSNRILRYLHMLLSFYMSDCPMSDFSKKIVRAKNKKQSEPLFGLKNSTITYSKLMFCSSEIVNIPRLAW